MNSNLSINKKEKAMAAKTHDITKALNGLRDNLDISPADREMLASARNKTRTFLKQRFGEELRLVMKGAGGRVLEDLPKPTFFTQGSYAYKTLNDPDPEHTPPQQMDLDDGVYFDASAVKDTSPKMLLLAMEGVLRAWAAKQGWKSETKPNCCRAILPTVGGGVPNKHIDWPIYCVSDEQMSGLKRQGRNASDLTGIFEEFEIPYLPSAKGVVMLAHKEKGWVESDPREVLEWVLERRREHGMGFLNVCRYLKAWRDHQWADSPLSSIAIMVIVAKAFAEECRNGKKDDDDMLLAAARQIAPCLRDGVFAPFDSERLDRLSDNDRLEIQGRARSFSGDIDRCLSGGISKTEICATMRVHFGNRFPNKTALILECGNNTSSAAAAVAAGIASAPVTQPVVAAIRPYAGKE